MDYWRALDTGLEAAILTVLVIEYIYDRSIVEKQLSKKIRHKKKTVSIQIIDGKAQILHKPNDIEVIISDKGQR